MVLGGLLKAVSPLVSILSGLLGGNIVYDWNSLVRDTIGFTKRWTPVAYFPQGTSVPFWHTNLNITGPNKTNTTHTHNSSLFLRFTMLSRCNDN
jgi:hypothetical protein